MIKYLIIVFIALSLLVVVGCANYAGHTTVAGIEITFDNRGIPSARIGYTTHDDSIIVDKELLAASFKLYDDMNLWNLSGGVVTFSVVGKPEDIIKILNQYKDIKSSDKIKE